MKTIKILAIAIVTMFSFSAAEAQVRIHATIGARPVYHRVVTRPVYHERVVVSRRPYYGRPVYGRPVYGRRYVTAYHRPYYRSHYVRPVYRRY